MSINWLLLGGHQSQIREVIEDQQANESKVVSECYCPNGHSILTDMATFQGYPGLTLKLKNKTGEGLLVISSVLGDRGQTTFAEPVTAENEENVSVT